MDFPFKALSKVCKHPIVLDMNCMEFNSLPLISTSFGAPPSSVASSERRYVLSSIPLYFSKAVPDEPVVGICSNSAKEIPLNATAITFLHNWKKPGRNEHLCQNAVY